LKILHVLNTAGVASIIARFMDEAFETESSVLTRKAHDPYGFTTYGEILPHGFWHFLLTIVLEAKKYDIIHIHARDILIPALKTIYPGNPVIINYHGTKIRGAWKERRKYWRRADRILVSTTDLLEDAPAGVIHIPNPVDTSIFYAMKVDTPDNEALYIKYGADDIAEDRAKTYRMKLTVHDRRENPIPYMEMPGFLRKFKALVDVKKDLKGNILYPEGTMSKTALEALACGLMVIPYRGEIIQNLPERHRPQNVASKIYGIYREVLD